jgi:hypothetical protein
MHPIDIEIQLDAVDYQTDAFGALKPTTAGRTLDVSSGGEAGIDLANVGSPSTTLNLSGTTIKTATDIEVDTQDIQNRLPSGLVGGRMASIAEVVGDKTGYKLASDGLSLVTSWAVGITGNITGNLSGSVGSVTGNVGGNVTGSVGSISGVTFPTNFDALGINSSGHVSRVVLVDTTTTNTDMRGTDGAALATHWTSTRAGYLDGVLISANYNQRTVQVTGSNHVASDIHELQPAVIASTHFAAGAIDANALASSAVTEIGVGVWVSAGYAAAIRAAVGLAAADLDTQLDAIAAAVNPGAVWTDPAAATTIRAAMGLATANLDAQLAAALVLQKLAASGATGSVQVTDNGNGTATLVFKDTNGTTTLATVTYNYTSGARTRVS